MAFGSDAVTTEKQVRALRGLSDAEAATRLRVEGPNELPTTSHRGILDIAREVVREPMILLLVACSTVYLVLGDIGEALVLLASVGVVIGIAVYQDTKSERALEALRELSSPRALVIRDGNEQRIPAREVVRGDLVVVAEGDRVPADGIVLWSVSLVVDESLLTGESVPVRKASGGEDAAPGRPGGDDSPSVYSGTLVVAGHGIVRVHSTGVATELGRIGKALGSAVGGETRLQREVRKLVRILASTGAVVCLLATLLYGALRQSWLDGILAGLALAMSMVPEEFPVILTLFLALGAWRIARRNVLVRRMPALEALGATTVLCIDKTGTLTQNRMAVTTLSVDGARFDADDASPLPEEFHRLLEFAVLASQENPFDPMERAINALAGSRLRGTEHLHDTWILEREYPLSRALLAMSHVWREPGGAGWIVAAKGAPEAIVDLCHVDATAAAAVSAEAAALAGRGLRVLGVAAARFPPGSLPPEQHDFAFELLGLVALSDPIRPGAPAAVAECRRAGIRTVMVTGDYPTTARQIATTVGLAPPDVVVTGAELESMSREELARRVGNVNVFARVVPEQKLRLVEAFAATGAVVAMTGDGVNDAPALRAADIGIAMGGHGTEVAREAADLVVLDDDLSSIAQAVRLGRRVYDNIRKATGYVLAMHIPIAGLALLPVALDWPLVLLPVHIVLLELIIDPTCSIAFEAEPEEPDVMDRPPRRASEPLLAGGMIPTALVQGSIALALVSAILGLAVHRGYDETHARTVTFCALVLSNFALILANRSRVRSAVAMLRVPNRALAWVFGAALAVLVIGMVFPPVRALLRFARPSALDLLAAFLAGGLALIGFESVKRIARRRFRTLGATVPQTAAASWHDIRVDRRHGPSPADSRHAPKR